MFAPLEVQVDRLNRDRHVPTVKYISTPLSFINLPFERTLETGMAIFIPFSYDTRSDFLASRRERSGIRVRREISVFLLSNEEFRGMFLPPCFLLF